jgi:hypothetical protein
MQIHRKTRRSRKISPYIVDTNKVNDLMDHYGVTLRDIGNRIEYDPSTIGRNIRNEVRSFKLQRRLARYFRQLTKGAVKEEDLLLRPDDDDVPQQPAA